MKIRFKKLDECARVPYRATSTDAGYDLYATSVSYEKETGNTVYGTGLAVEIPEGYMGLVFPRSSIAKKQVFLRNAVGVIDPGYRGEITAKFGKTAFAQYVDSDSRQYSLGDRVAQMVIVPFVEVEWEEVDSLGQTERGKGGYGSSGR